jgi:cytoskeletal protein CcmA (bactofilin family)
MSEKRTVTCPYCKSEQEEPFAAISTYCHTCGRHIPIQRSRRRPVAMVPQNTRVVECRECGYTDKIVADAQSTQCENCSAYLDLRCYTIRGKSNQKIVTYGDVTFAPGCSYEGPPVRASKVTVAGRVSALIKADSSIEILEGGRINNPIDAPIIKICRGSEVRVPLLRTRNLELASQMRTDEVTATDQIIILPGGSLIAGRVKTRFIEVQEGGALLAGFLEVVPPIPPLDFTDHGIAKEDQDEAIA